MEEKKKTPLEGFSQKFIKISQLMKPNFPNTKPFTNPTVSKRLSPGGPDPKHH